LRRDSHYGPQSRTARTSIFITAHGTALTCDDPEFVNVLRDEAAGISLTALHDVDALVLEPHFKDGGFPSSVGARVGLGAPCAEGPGLLRIDLGGGRQVAVDPRPVKKLRALQLASRDAEPDAVGDGEQRRQAEPGIAAPNS
jgi:hypothetical protein